MSTIWQEMQISDVCESIVDCVNKTAPTVDFVTPYKMIRTTNVKNGNIDLSSVKYVTEDVYSKWTRRSTPQIGDVILTREAPIGEVGMVKTEDMIFLGQRLMKYRANPDFLNPRFLLYSMQSPYMQKQILSHEGTGSTVSHIRVPDCMKFRIRVPELSIQNRIADILGSLDDKIDLNRDMNETLEQMAMALYKHWFSEGDEEVKLTDIIEINPTISIKKDTPTFFVDMKALPVDSMSVSNTDIIVKPFTSGSKFMKNDVLFARITPCLENGKTAFVDFLEEGEPGFGSTEFLVFRATGNCCPQYVYCLSRNPEFRAFAIKSMVGTSGRQRIQTSSLSEYMVAKPNPELMERFVQTTKDWFDQIRSNTQEISELKKIKDFLLPRLLSGEIEVKAAEEQVEEVLADG